MYPESTRNVRHWYPRSFADEVSLTHEHYRPGPGVRAEFVCFGIDVSSSCRYPLRTFPTLEELGDELHKWIFVERDFDMFRLRLQSMKAVAFHMHENISLNNMRGHTWMLLTTDTAHASDAPWRRCRHTAADWLMLMDDLRDRMREQTGDARLELLKHEAELLRFNLFIMDLRDGSDDESDDEDDTPAKRRRTELVQKIGSILDENTNALKENDYRVAMDALKELI